MFQYTQGMIDDFWFQVQCAYDIEPRSYFEEKYPTCPMMMAVHYMWKRDVRERKLDTQSGKPGWKGIILDDEVRDSEELDDGC